MKKRALGNTGMQVGEVSLGCEHLQGKDEKRVFDVIDRALERGVNFMDVFMSEPNVRTYIGRALSGRRRQAIIQGHIGACWIDGQYAVRRDLDSVKYAFDDLLARLDTDYIDVGMIHFLDNADEWDRLADSDTMRYALRLRETGVIRALGMSGHDPSAAIKAVNSGLIEVLMFSVNPAYDLLPDGLTIDEIMSDDEAKYAGALGAHPQRARLYRLCEAKGVGITVMKALAAGALLNPSRTPFNAPMSVYQCLNYALTRPAVAAVMLGMQTVEEVDHAAAYDQADGALKDYAAALSTSGRYNLRGACMYCNHCLPCPARLDIAQINKYLDLSEAGGDTAQSVRAHYLSMGHTAGECLACGACEKRCPFGVPVIERMRKAKATFGK